MIVRSITPQNLMHIDFSEPVKLVDNTALSTDNINIQIIGS